MTPVDQEFAHDPASGQHGDCMRAVLAALLDLPIAEVPHFAQLDAEGKGNFWLLITEFCRSKGYSFVMVGGCRGWWSEDAIYHGISGISPRNPNGHHAVVGQGGRIIHDPHPSRAGLAGDPAEWKYYFLVRLGDGP